MGGGSALSPSPREGRGRVRSGVGCVARIQACIPHPHPPHLEAPALETSGPGQQLQKLGTRSQLSWPVGRGREREGPGRGYLLLSPSPAEGRGGRPQLGRASRVSVELGTAGGGGAEGGAGEGRAAAPPPLPRTPLLRQKLPDQLRVLSVGAAGCWWKPRGPAGCLRSSAGRAQRGVCGCRCEHPRPDPPHAALAVPAALCPGLVGADG